jgi:aryl-alcohol dehydrogenase-like predicted oxidoreductase
LAASAGRPKEVQGDFMQYRKLGSSGLIVSRLAFGAMTFGSDPSIPAIYKVDQDNARAMLEKSLEAGINFFDTADAYAGGQSEAMLGNLLGKRRKDVVIASKVGFRTGESMNDAGLSRKHILSSCDGSLKRLNTDYIDLYIVHKEDPNTPIEESLEALNDLARMGKVRYIGFSNWSAWKAATALEMQKARGWAQFTSGQLYYSLLGRDVEHDIAPFVRYAGLGMTVWSPLAGGFLSGKYTRENLTDDKNRLSGFDQLPFDKEFGFKLVERMTEIAKRREASVAQAAIAWLLAKPIVSSIIVGASKLHQLEDNLKAVDLKLSEEEIKELDQMTAPAAIYPHWFNANLEDAQRKKALATER